MSRSILRKVLFKAVGFIVFLVIILAVNVVAAILPEPHLVGVVQFLNSNFLLLVLMNLLIFFGDVFSLLDFPLNLPAPIFHAIGGVFIVSFIIKVFELVAALTEGLVVINLMPIAVLLYLLVFMIVFLVGYIVILIKAISRREEEAEPHQPRIRKRRRRDNK